MSISSSSRDRRLAFLALLGGATGIAFAPILVRWSVTPPITTALWRLILAQPFLWLWLAVELRGPAPSPQPRTKRDHLLLVFAGVMFAADMAVWNWSVVLTTVSNATLFPNFAPVFVMIGARLYFHERITLNLLLGLAVAMTGAVVLLGASVQISREHLLGDICGLVTAIVYAAYMLAVKGLRARFSTATIMAWSGLPTIIPLALAAWLTRENMWTSDPRGWLVILGLALLAQIGGQGLIAYAFAHLPAGFCSLSLLFQPVMATAFAWVLLGERPTLLQAGGGLAILTGIAVASGRLPGARAGTATR